MTVPLPSINKRTVLGGQYWLVAVTVALSMRGLPLAAVLAVAGAYLVFAPVVRSRRAEPSKFLLRAE